MTSPTPTLGGAAIVNDEDVDVAAVEDENVGPASAAGA